MTQEEIASQMKAAVDHHNAARLPEAEAIYRRVLAADPKHVDALHLLGVLAAQAGHREPALSLLRQAVKLAPEVCEFQLHLADLLMQLDRYGEALMAFGQAARISPRDHKVLLGAGECLLKLNRPAEAIAPLSEAREIAPGEMAVQGRLAVALARSGRMEEAKAGLDKLGETPEAGLAWAHLAEDLWGRHEFEAAVPAAQRLARYRPNDPLAINFLGNALQTTAQFEAAIATYREALKLAPDSFDATSNVALTVMKTGEVAEALKLYDQALERWPKSAALHANRSLALLTLGDFERGLAEYEWRSASEIQRNQEKLSQPLWDGSDLTGKSILLTPDQGAGDLIHFVRYAPMVAARGGRVIVSASPDLHGLVSKVRGVHQVVAAHPLPRTDVYATLASLPCLLRTTIETIPADVPYIFADPARVKAWRARLAGDANFKVGIAWAGNPHHLNDRARSCGLAAMGPLAGVEGVSLYSLQKGPPAADARRPPAGMNLIDLTNDLRDYSDTAAFMMNVDLVISIDTSIVHLAGAMARPVWTLLARGPDWRWMLEREDTPWYPTMRLFRQRELRQWGPVLERAAYELRKLVKERR